MTDCNVTSSGQKFRNWNAYLQEHPPALMSRQTRHIYPMFDQCWANVVDGGPTLVKHWLDVSCLLGWHLFFSEANTCLHYIIISRLVKDFQRNIMFPPAQYGDIVKMCCPWARHFTLKCFTWLRWQWVPGRTEIAMCAISSMRRNDCRTVCSPWSWNGTHMNRSSDHMG